MFLSYLSHTVRGSNTLPLREVGLAFEGSFLPPLGYSRTCFYYQYVTKLVYFDYKTIILPFFFLGFVICLSFSRFFCSIWQIVFQGCYGSYRGLVIFYSLLVWNKKSPDGRIFLLCRDCLVVRCEVG